MAITPTQIAVAAEAFNRVDGISPTARRLGIELINHCDRKTGCAWPSEARLAECLGVTDRAIRSAKAQLAAKGLISWHQRGRHHHRTPLYEIAWSALMAIAKGIKERVKAASAPFRRKSDPPPRPADNRDKSGLGRNMRSSYLTHNYSFKGFGGKPAAKSRKSSTRIPVAVIEQKAGNRLWQNLAALPGFETICNTITPEIEASAVKAERFKPGSGVSTLLSLLKKAGAA